MLAHAMSHLAGNIVAMKQITVWQWTMRSATTGRVARSRWKMTEADAKALDPMAQRVVGTQEVRTIYEHPDEMPVAHSTSFPGAHDSAQNSTNGG
jgi:hypothetical protein